MSVRHLFASQTSPQSSASAAPISARCVLLAKWHTHDYDCCTKAGAGSPTTLLWHLVMMIDGLLCTTPNSNYHKPCAGSVSPDSKARCFVAQDLAAVRGGQHELAADGAQAAVRLAAGGAGPAGGRRPAGRPGWRSRLGYGSRYRSGSGVSVRAGHLSASERQRSRGWSPQSPRSCCHTVAACSNRQVLGAPI